MSFKQCMDEAVKGREISRADADSLITEFERRRAGHMRSNPSMADALAKRDLVESMTASTKEKRRQAKLALTALRRLDANVRSHKKGGRFDVIDGFRKVLEHQGEATFESVAGRRGALMGLYMARMAEVLDHFRRGALTGELGRHNNADMRDFLRECFGIDTGNPKVRALANAWLDAAELSRKDFNAAGGTVGKLDNWGMPQHHDVLALRKVGVTAWKEAIRPRLDLEKMRHPLTGTPIEAHELDHVLEYVFETITSEGWMRVNPSRQAFGRGALANQRAEHRFLVFKGPDDWLAYQEDFGGGGDFISNMVKHLEGMARDTAAMQLLGPNPAGTVEWMKQALMKEAQSAAAGKPARIGHTKPKNAVRRATIANFEIDKIWSSLRGDMGTPVNTALGDTMATIRAVVGASVMGTAAISSITDIPRQMIVRHMAGLPATSTVRQMLKGFTRLERKEAVAAGLILDDALHTLSWHARKAGLLGARQWAEYAYDRVIAVTGLAPFTQAGKHAFGLEFMAHAARHAGSDFAALPEWFRKTFERYGISDGDWEKMRRVKLHEKYDGTQVLRPVEIQAQVHPDIASRYLAMIQTETRQAIIEPTHRSRVLMTGGTRPGTVIGEMIRTGAMLKSFPVTMLMIDGARTLRMMSGNERLGGPAYAGAMLLATTVFGAAALQFKQVAAMKDPRDVTTPEFWGAAVLQGGGLGLYGDFFFSDVNRYGNGKVASMLGPVAARAEDVLGLTQMATANAVLLGSDEAPNLGRAVTRFMRTNIPGGNIWYLRQAWERDFLDQLQFQIDPDANKAFKRAQRRAATDYGQEFWWKPGETLPSRPPSLGAAVGQR